MLAQGALCCFSHLPSPRTCHLLFKLSKCCLLSESVQDHLGRKTSPPCGHESLFPEEFDLTFYLLSVLIIVLKEFKSPGHLEIQAGQVDRAYEKGVV